MHWQEEFEEFKVPFQKFSDLIHKKNLSEDEAHELAEQINRTALHGWRTLRQYMAEERHGDAADYEAFESIAKNGFDQNFNSLKDSFEHPQSVMVDHDLQYLHENEWEIREVVFPAFRDLNEFLEKKKKSEGMDQKNAG